MDADDDVHVFGSARDPDFVEISLPEIVRYSQTGPIPIPMQDPDLLPLASLDPESLERLVAELVSRQDNLGSQFYGRRGQKQWGLDIVELESVGVRRLYQVKRFQELSSAMIRDAVTDYAGTPKAEGNENQIRRFEARKFVLVTSAKFEYETGNVDALAELQEAYRDDLDLEVWGAESLSRRLRDAPRLVLALFGPEWAKAYCGFEAGPDEQSTPNPLGLLEGPITLLHLDVLERDAREAEVAEPLTAARLYGVIATALDDSNFPGHATMMRRRQAGAAQTAGDTRAAFSIRFGMAMSRILSGQDFQFSDLRIDLSRMTPDLEFIEQQKLSVVMDIGQWHDQGSDLGHTVPALRSIISSGDQDAGVLCCLVIERAIVDGLYDFVPPHSVVATTDGDTPQLLLELRNMAEALSNSDPVIRARLRCSVADALLTADSLEGDIEAVFQEVLSDASAGRMLHARGLVCSRAAYAFAVRGHSARAENLWRQSVLSSCEDGFYGDAYEAMRAIQHLQFQAGRIDSDSLALAMSALPNRKHILAGPYDPALAAFEAAHRERAVEAFGESRRFIWEARLAGHLFDEMLALSLFGDVLRDGDRPSGAIDCYVAAGDAKNATELAAHSRGLADVLRWAPSGFRRRRSAVAQVIGAQASLIPDEEVESYTDVLFSLTDHLWTSTLVSPQPELDALKGIVSFGVRIPESAVDRILAIAEPALASPTAASETVAALLIQTYWAVDSRRDDLADALHRMMNLEPPPHNLWDLVSAIPSTARAPLAPIVHGLAEEGSESAINTLGVWRETFLGVQLAARRACAALLRRPSAVEGSASIIGTQEQATVQLLLALLDSDQVFEIDPIELTNSKSSPAGGVIASTWVVAPPPHSPGDGDGTSQVSLIPGEPPDVSWQDSGPNDEIDEVAVIAAGPPAVLVEVVAEKLVAIGEDRIAGASSRVQALLGLRWLIDRIEPTAAGEIADRLANVYKAPNLTEGDQFEIDSDDPFSRMRIQTGAGDLTGVALLSSAEALARSANGVDVDVAYRAKVDVLFVGAMDFLLGTNERTRSWGAHTMAAIASASDEFKWMAVGLTYHQDERVRAAGAAQVAADIGILEVLANDPSVRVRIELARRANELSPAVRGLLELDPSLRVRYLIANSAAAQGG
jgi:hypothetical protein